MPPAALGVPVAACACIVEILLSTRKIAGWLDHLKDSIGRANAQMNMRKIIRRR
jgi:hypothetical protein